MLHMAKVEINRWLLPRFRTVKFLTETIVGKTKFGNIASKGYGLKIFFNHANQMINLVLNDKIEFKTYLGYCSWIQYKENKLCNGE